METDLKVGHYEEKTQDAGLKAGATEGETQRLWRGRRSAEC
jgi:hypothetical protein